MKNEKLKPIVESRERLDSYVGGNQGIGAGVVMQEPLSLTEQ